MKPNLNKLENLSDNQLHKLSNDIDTIGIRKAAAQATKDTNGVIDKTCVQRFKERTIARRFLVESPDAAQAAAEILRFAVTGRPDFSEATVKVLEETAFKLSLECADSGDELKSLNQITVMLARYRTASVRERMAKIQEDKLQLRREEFEWKKSIQASKSDNKSALRTPPSEIQQDPLGALAKTLDDVERRACAMFNQPYSGPINSNHCSSRGDEALEQTSPATEARASASAPSSEASVPPAMENSSPSPSLCSPCLGGESPSLPSAQISAVRTPQSAIAEPYLQTENFSEPTEARTSASAPSSPSREQNSLTTTTSSSAPTASSPVKTESPSLSLLPSVPNSALRMGQSGSDPHSAILVSHAIRRWRAHIPRPPGAPEPDGSWRDECPCGNRAPCPDHPELKGRVRPYKPQHPEYQLSLKEFNVPYYKPTADELGCTQEALDRSCNLFADNPKMKDPPHPVVDPFKTKQSLSAASAPLR